MNKKKSNTLKKKTSRINGNKEGNWIGGGDFDEKEFADGHQWKVMRK